MPDKKSKSKGIAIELKIPDKVSARVENGIVFVKGPKGEVKKNLLDKKVSIESKDGSIMLKTPEMGKINKKCIKSYAAHIRSMIKGSIDGYKYTLKICSGHFPMSVTVSNNQFTVKNFLGEKVPRLLKIKQGVKVEVQGDNVKVTGQDKELVSQTAADIEQLTRITNRDRRIFQDGLYITQKAGEEE